MSSAPAWTFDPTWRSFSAVQGGVIVGSLLRAARGAVMDRSGRPAVVRTATAHFLEAVLPDEPVVPSVRLNRLGSTSSVHAEAWQGDALRALAQVLVTTARDQDDPTPVVADADLPTGFRTPDDAEPLAVPPDFVPFTRHLDVRAVGAGRPLAGGPEPRLTAWIRPRDRAALAGPLVQLGVVADALPPSLYATRTTPIVLPTVELTLHLVRAVPPVGAWLRVDQWTSWQDAHVCIDDALLHDAQGRLVARTRQTRRVLRR
ncbi:thioesterase family protein [Nakamurella deserti]|uniref:thioesterase family protein n=1 Tax=Nakamurella deserti TaxID=2164074 RepID=UPI0013008E69|nr:thioesterase family protein [Nakamurella deserti]